MIDETKTKIKIKMNKVKQKIKKSFFNNLSTVMTIVWHTVFLLAIINTHHMKIGHHDTHSKHPVFIGGVDEITHFLHLIVEIFV